MLRHAVTPKPKPIRVLAPKKRKKASSRVLLERKADHLVREIVLDRDGYCVCPSPKKGHTDVLQAGHLIKRRKESTRWDLWCVSVQCAGCNERHNHYPELYINWFTQQFGKEALDRVVQDSIMVRKLSLEELEIICNELTAIHRRQLDCLRDGVEYKPRYTQKQIASGEWKYERNVSTSLPELQGVPSISSQQGWR